MNSFVSEVCTQGEVLNRIFKYYDYDDFKIFKKISDYYHENNFKKIILTGMGSSLYATYSVKNLFVNNGITTICINSYELSNFSFNLIDNNTLVIAISQSGKSKEVINLVEKAKKITKIVGIYNNYPSLLSEICDFCVPMHAGSEVSITSKTYSATILILNILSLFILNKNLSDFKKNINECIQWCIEWIQNYKFKIESYLELFNDVVLFDLLANDSSSSTSSQISLAYREGLHNCCAKWELADYAHGQYHSSKMGNEYLAQLFVPDFFSDESAGKMTEFIINHGGKVLLYTYSNVGEKNNFKVIKLPKLDKAIMPIAESIVAETILGELLGEEWIKDH